MAIDSQYKEFQRRLDYLEELLQVHNISQFDKEMIHAVNPKQIN